MRVVKLVAENVKGLKAVEITPDEHFQFVSGKNGQGKSSVLDAIWYAIGGGTALKEAEKPIRNGEEQATVTVDLGDIVVTRRWKGSNTTLNVATKDGAKYSSPQSMLDSLIGRLSFDPFAFANLKESEQRKALTELVELPIDLDELDTKRKTAFDNRTLVNREVKQIEGQLSAMSAPSEDTPKSEVSAADLMQKLQEASDTLTDNNIMRRSLEDLARKHQRASEAVSNTEREIERLTERLDQERRDLQFIHDEGVALKAQVAALVDPDFDGLKQQLADIEQTNQRVREAQKYDAVHTQLLLKQGESESLTTHIGDIDKAKESALKAAKFPIDGLGFDENGVTFNGIPFKQCSSAERLKVSMAMAMALNPKLRVIRIMDGSLLDGDNLKLIEEMAREQDYQVWCEVVDASGTVGVYIEDGQVKEAQLA